MRGVANDRLMEIAHLDNPVEGTPGQKSIDYSGFVRCVVAALWSLFYRVACFGSGPYLTGQSDWLVNYAQRHRAGLRVGTAITEGTADFLVNRRMNKSQHMRWSRRGADLLL
jgi:hypothetical protein